MKYFVLSQKEYQEFIVQNKKERKLMKDLSNDKMVQIEKDNVSVLQFRALKKYEPDLKHGYTMKDMDFSRGPHLEGDIEKLQKSQNVKSMWIRTGQTHSDHIKVIRKGEDPPQILEDTDGVITNQKGLFVITTFADCTPILIYDTKNKVIANIHSGWKGTIKKIGLKALELMKSEFNTNPKDCIVTIGPNIQSCCFEVQDDVKEIFENTYGYLKNWNDVIEEKGVIDGNKKYLINTSLILETLFKEAGIPEEQIHQSHICTKCNSEQLHSFRVEKESYARSTMFTILQEKE